MKLKKITELEMGACASTSQKRYVNDCSARKGKDTFEIDLSSSKVLHATTTPSLQYVPEANLNKNYFIDVPLVEVTSFHSKPVINNTVEASTIITRRSRKASEEKDELLGIKPVF